MEGPTASGQILMNVGPGTDVTENQKLSIVLDESNLHPFDTETEKALVHGLSEPVGVDTGVDTSTETEISGDDD